MSLVQIRVEDDWGQLRYYAGSRELREGDTVELWWPNNMAHVKRVYATTQTREVSDHGVTRSVKSARLCVRVRRYGASLEVPLETFRMWTGG